MDDILWWGSVILIYVVIEIILRFLIDGKLGSHTLYEFEMNGTVYEVLRSIFICALASILIRSLIDVWLYGW